MYLRIKICLRFRYFLFVFSSKYCSATKFYLLRMSFQTICGKYPCGSLKRKILLCDHINLSKIAVFKKASQTV